ncbi:MAG: DUF6044 family protein [Butyrivibrio sp.]|nr:DUF6044 family protein [Butyrivibrio sp.]
MKKNWYIVLITIFIMAVFIFYLCIGENSYIAVHDNLDLFVAQFQMLKNRALFMAHDVSAPFLGGVTRDGLPSEISLYSILYMIFPSFYAYITGYLCKILIGVSGSVLLARDVIGKEKYDTAKPFAWMCGFAYGILNLFPAYGIPFASIPFIVLFLRKVYREGFTKAGIKWFVLVFCYPFVSYFSYFGIFILAYLVVAIIWLWIRDRKPSFPLIFSVVVLAIGNMVFEYRLFGMMLFSDVESIRSTMVESSLNAKEIISMISDVLVNGMMHADDAHKSFVMPVCIIYFLVLNIGYIRLKNVKGIFTDIFNLGVLLIIFNSVVYGIYYSKFFRSIVETILPPLKGWQFNRTIFFSPFVWYAMLFVVCYRLYIYAAELERNTFKIQYIRSSMIKVISYLIPVVAIAVILLQPQRYNDLYSTAFGTAYRIVKGKSLDALDYKEFYSEELFDTIKADLNYDENEWAVAYGMHPAILEYNNISTLDGYLGFYSQSYKEEFRKIIAPALERMPETKLYFDNWGARCYLYSGTDVSIVMATRSMYGVTDTDIYIDSEALSNLGGKYIFSRIEISNVDEAGLEFIKSYDGTEYGSPYMIYVYTIKNTD